MKIALDIDEVLRDIITPVLDIYKTRFDKRSKIKKDDITGWNLEKYLPKLKDAKNDLFYYYAERIFLVSKPYSDTKKTLEKLSENHEIHLASNQFKGLEKFTLFWLYNNEIPYDHLHFTSDKNSVRCDLLVDDGVHNLKNFDGLSIAMDRPWNQEWKGERIYNLSELNKYLR